MVTIAPPQQLPGPDAGLHLVREHGAGVTIQSDLEGILNLKAFSCRYTSTLTNPLVSRTERDR